MKKKLLNISVVGLILIGAGMLLYPTVSNRLAEQNQSKIIFDYTQKVAEMKAENIKEEFQKAKKYNDALSGANIEDPFIPGSGMELPDNYTSILNVTEDDVICYVEIPKIKVNLPVYHGVSDEVLQKGVGHMENTAFPIGGNGNHPVLTAHTGLSHAKLFTDLGKLMLEDIFYIHVLDQTLAYQVDQILVVEPDETEELLPVKGEDYISLVTCTPYGINTHRLLVRGTRIPYVEEAEQAAALPWLDWKLAMVVALIVTAVFSYIVDRYKKKRKTRDGGNRQ